MSCCATSRSLEVGAAHCSRPGSPRRPWELVHTGMRTAGLWGLLWTLLVSELGAAPEDNEEEYVLEAGQNLTVSCPFNIWKYASSQKAWQRLEPGQEPLTLVVTDRPSGKPSTVRVGRYELEDDPDEAMLSVRMTQLRVADSGLYRCVIYHPPKDPVVLFHPVRLLVTQGQSVMPTSNKHPPQSPTPIPIFTPTTPKVLSTRHSRPRTLTQTPPRSTAVVSTPRTGVHLTNVTHVTRIPVFGIVVSVVCGLLSKSLVFTVLLAVTHRSFSP
ncbi:triggering receptor expressed on myeloid cells 1-like [Oryctolagus cuniculus]|uniref:triggering receptor expressed on myeloid cells 1-like n=1 Tax=Oryctolagus cuniculus TaxID=9986 RepID=UPI00387A091E